MQIFALVDYDNVKPVQKERAGTDVEDNVYRITRRATSVVKEFFPGHREIALRLYGGWTDRANKKTASGNWIYQATANVRGKHNGIRVLPEVATNNYGCGFSQYIGLYRDGGQKMVDTLIVSDLITLCTNYDCPVLLMSDDEDMLPGLVASRSAWKSLAVLRNRPFGEAMNDHVLGALNIRIAGGVT